MAVLKNIAKVIALILLFVIVAILLFNLFLNIKLFEFYSSSKSIGDVPGLNDGAVQQGLVYVEEENALLASCYMTDKSASRIYVMKDGKTTFTKLKKADGTDYTGHVGGICYYGDYLYAGKSNGLIVFNLDDIFSESGEAKAVGTVDLINTASWCTVYDGHIYAGTYLDPIGPQYMPSEEHIIPNPSVKGEANCSVMTKYKLTENGGCFGIDNTAPVDVYSIIGTAQGGVFTEDGRLIISTSRGIALSCFYFYDMEKAKDNKTTYTHEGKEYPTVFLGTDSLTYKLEGPPMAEEIVVINNTMYIINESACSKYLFGNLIGGRELYVVNIKDSWLGK